MNIKNSTNLCKTTFFQIPPKINQPRLIDEQILVSLFVIFEKYLHCPICLFCLLQFSTEYIFRPRLCFFFFSKFCSVWWEKQLCVCPDILILTEQMFFFNTIKCLLFLLMFQITAADYEGWLILLGFELNFVDIVYVDALRNNSILFVFFVSVCIL